MRTPKEKQRQKPPRGVMPYDLWDETVGYDPSLEELDDRYEAVFAALSRYRLAGLKPMDEWLVELGLVERWSPLPCVSGASR